MLNNTSLNTDFKLKNDLDGINRETLSLDDFCLAKPFLQKAFEAFKPRSAFLSKSKRIEDVNVLQLEEDERPNIVMRDFALTTEKVDGMPYFEEVFANFPHYEMIDKKFTAIENFVRTRIKSCKTHFITFSTNMTGARKGIQHLHPMMTGKQCYVWSFCIPLYLSQEGSRHCFWYNHQRELFKPRYYLDYRHLKKLNINYNSLSMPVDGKIFSIQFDGARTPHYIDYTNHLYAWLVFDGVEYKSDIAGREAFELHLY